MIEISVIIPALRPDNFEGLIQSIENNSENNIEWIVIDDGSEDSYSNIFESLPKKIRLVRNIHNTGQASARNSGLKLAKGNWVKFLDADDILDKNHLTTLHQYAIKSNYLVFASTKHVFPDGTSYINKSWKNIPLESHAQLKRQLVNPFLSHCGVLFPRDLLEEIGGYDSELVTDEDGDLLLRILLKGYIFFPVKEVNYCYVHRFSNNRVSTDNNLGKLYSRLKVCEKIISCNSSINDNDIYYCIAQRIDKIAISFWLKYPKEAKNLLSYAKDIAPNYKSDMHIVIRVVRHIFGIRSVIVLQNLYRNIKRHFKRGAKI